MREQLADFIIQHEGRVAPFGDALGMVRRRGNLLPDGTATNDMAEGLRKVLSDRDAFSRIRTYSQADVAMSPVQRRQTERLYRLFLAYQCEPRLEEATYALESTVREDILGFRCDLGAGPLGWSDIWPVFVQTEDVRVRREAWTKLMDLADHLAPSLLELVATRNRAARDQGFDNYLDLAITLRELDEAPMEDLFRAAVEHTHTRFSALKDELDKDLADWLKTRRGFMGPWHYPNPLRLLPSWDLETTRPPRREAVTATQAFLRHRGLTLPAEKIRPSEVSGRDSKRDPWALLVDVGRVLVGVVDALFEAHADPELPEILRRSPHPILSWAVWHILVDEIASPDVLEGALNLDAKAAGKLRGRFQERHRRETLLLVHHGLATFSFERSLYANPGQDLTSLWWDLLRESLLLDPRDESGHAAWAVAPELLCSPASGIERAVGALVAAQLRETFPPAEPGSTMLRNPEASAALKELVLHHAGGRSWQYHVRKTTGLNLGARAFIELMAPSEV